MEVVGDDEGFAGGLSRNRFRADERLPFESPLRLALAVLASAALATRATARVVRDSPAALPLIMRSLPPILDLPLMRQKFRAS